MSLYFVTDLSVELPASMARSQVFNAANNFKAVMTTPEWTSKPSWMVVAIKGASHSIDVSRS
jgi:hypothetical protein